VWGLSRVPGGRRGGARQIVPTTCTIHSDHFLWSYTCTSPIWKPSRQIHQFCLAYLPSGGYSRQNGVSALGAFKTGQDLETSDRPLLLWTKTGLPFQPNTLGPQNNWPSMDNLLHHLALQKWRAVWEKLWRTMNYRITYYTRIGKTHLSPDKGSSFRRRFQHAPCTTNQRGHEMDETPPGCIPSNSRSVLGAKRWPRLSPLHPCITTCVVAIAGRCMIAP
jgi:hypothetical protein